MPISFNQISNTNRVPGPYAEIDGSKALSVQGSQPHRVLIVGLRQSTGTAAQGEIKTITGELDGDPFFGSRSQLADACRAFKRVNKTAACFAMALDENAGGIAATCTFPLVGTSTVEGTLRVRVGDKRISVALATASSAAMAATALTAALTATDRLMFTAAATTGTVTLTCVHKGEVGNGFTLEVESIPAGLTCTPTQPTNGATNPTMSTAVAALDEERYDTIITCLTDAPSLLALENEMARREGPTVKMPGMVFAAVRGTHSTLVTYGAARNSRFSSVFGSGLSPTPPWVFASQVAARDAQRCDTQANRPRNGLTLPDCEAPKKADRFDISERNLQLYDGISTYKVDNGGNVMIERLITTYQTNASSLADATYLAIETVRNLHGIYLEALSIGGKYADFNLAPDGTNVSPGVAVLTPKAFKGELIAWYSGLVQRGRCKDEEGFAEDLICEINALDVERLDVQLSPRLVNGLVTLAMKISFQL